MATTTKNLGLTLTPEDTTALFRDWRMQINGDVNSNMMKIDEAFGGSIGKVYYATCTTASDDNAKVVTTTNGDFKLEDSALVIVRYSYLDRSTNTPRLNIDNTGAKTVIYPTGSKYLVTRCTMMSYVEMYCYHPDSYVAVNWWYDSHIVSLYSCLGVDFSGDLTNLQFPYKAGHVIVSNGEVDATDQRPYLKSSDITTTELGYLDGVTSNIQTQLDGKYDSNSNIDCGTF